MPFLLALALVLAFAGSPAEAPPVPPTPTACGYCDVACGVAFVSPAGWRLEHEGTGARGHECHFTLYPPLTAGSRVDTFLSIGVHQAPLPEVADTKGWRQNEDGSWTLPFGGQRTATVQSRFCRAAWAETNYRQAVEEGPSGIGDMYSALLTNESSSVAEVEMVPAFFPTEFQALLRSVRLFSPGTRGCAQQANPGVQWTRCARH